MLGRQAVKPCVWPCVINACLGHDTCSYCLQWLAMQLKKGQSYIGGFQHCDSLGFTMQCRCHRTLSGRSYMVVCDTNSRVHARSNAELIGLSDWHV